MPAVPKKSRPKRERPVVTVTVTVRNTPPDAACLEVQRAAMAMLLAKLRH